MLLGPITEPQSDWAFLELSYNLVWFNSAVGLLSDKWVYTILCYGFDSSLIWWLNNPGAYWMSALKTEFAPSIDSLFHLRRSECRIRNDFTKFRISWLQMVLIRHLTVRRLTQRVQVIPSEPQIGQRYIWLSVIKQISPKIPNFLIWCVRKYLICRRLSEALIKENSISSP